MAGANILRNKFGGVIAGPSAADIENVSQPRGYGNGDVANQASGYSFPLDNAGEGSFFIQGSVFGSINYAPYRLPIIGPSADGDVLVFNYDTPNALWKATFQQPSGGSGGGGGTITGSGSANQLTYWTGASAISGNSNLTYSPSTNTLKMTGTTGGLIIDKSGDPSPLTLDDNPFIVAYFSSEGRTSIYNPERMSGGAEGATIDPSNVYIVSSNPSYPSAGMNGPGISFTYSDDANNGSASATIQIVRAEGSFSSNEDGTLLVFGTRPNVEFFGPFDVKEGLRIGRNQFVGAYYKPGATQSPPAMLTVGTNLGDVNTIGFRETSVSISSITNYGQIYSKSSDKKMYYQNSTGTEFDLTVQTLSDVLTKGPTASTNINMAGYNITNIGSLGATAGPLVKMINITNAVNMLLMYNT